jgi:hypothetical protein
MPEQINHFFPRRSSATHSESTCTRYWQSIEARPIDQSERATWPRSLADVARSETELVLVWPFLITKQYGERCDMRWLPATKGLFRARCNGVHTAAASACPRHTSLIWGSAVVCESWTGSRVKKRGVEQS